MIKSSQKKLEEITNRYRLADVYLFGSQISGHKHPGSDFDIAIRFEKGIPNPQKRGKIYGNLFSDLISCFNQKNIDLVFIDEAPLHFQFKIVAEGELIYSKNKENSFNFKEKIINHYRDYKYFIDEYFRGALKISTRL